MNRKPAQRDIRGNLEATPVAHMLHTVHERKLTGRGTFERGEERIDLAFHDGAIVHAATNDPDLRLGEYLLQTGRITLEAYQRSVQILLETGRRQGEVLLELGALGPRELERAVEEQLKEIVYALMQWEQGTYLYRWSLPFDTGIRIRDSVYRLILTGMQRERRFSRLRDLLAPWNRRVLLNTGIPQEEARRVRFTPEESAVVALIDGRRTVGEVVATAPIPDFMAMRILYGLYWARLVHFEERDEDSAF